MPCNLLCFLSIILGQCRVLGISSVGLCQLFTAVIFHRPCASARRGMRRMKWIKQENYDIHELFPTSMLGLFNSCGYGQDSSCWCNIDGSSIWISVEACESSPIPCPHPSTLTCVSLTMETFSPRVGGGSALRKKKTLLSASLIMPLLETCVSSKPSTQTPFLCRVHLRLSTVMDRMAGLWSQ